MACGVMLFIFLFRRQHHIYANGTDVALCNPATREHRFIPQSEMVSKTSRWGVLGVGMGYDHRANDYRVVRTWKRYLGRGYVGYVVEEYALSTDSWKRIDIGNPSLLLYEFDIWKFAMHCKVVCYWWAAKLGGRTSTMVTLNVGGEVFQKVRLLHPSDINTSWIKHLGVLNGFVLLICRSDRFGEYSYFDIWVMDGAGAEGSCWTKLRSIEIKIKPCVPSGFWKDNELLFETHGKLGFYNIEGQRIADVFEAIHVTSLVSIKGRNQQVITMTWF